MKTLFHGTTKENYDRIMQEGFAPCNEVWNCSDISEAYFYDTDKTDHEDEDLAYRREECIRMAFESAQITAAIQDSKESELIVLEVVIDSELVEDDYSCENMSDRASTVNIDDLNKRGKIVNVHKAEEGYVTGLRFFYIAGLIENNYINTFQFTSIEEKALEIVSKAEIYIEELFVDEWESTEVEQEAA